MSRKYICNDMIDCVSVADMWYPEDAPQVPGITGKKPKYSNHRDYKIGDGSENGSYTTQSDNTDDWSRGDMKETGLNLRKPL